MDWVQGGSDILGLVPVLGEPAEGVNGLISLCRGDKVGAALSFGSMIPIAGWFSTGGKLTLKYGDEINVAGKTIIKVGENGKLAFKGGFTPGKWLTHFEKQGAEFGYKTSSQYLKGAQDLISKGINKADGVLNYTRKNGDFLVYNPATNEFAIVTKDGVIRTYFKPKDGMAYWKKEIGGK